MNVNINRCFLFVYEIDSSLNIKNLTYYRLSITFIRDIIRIRIINKLYNSLFPFR